MHEQGASEKRVGLIPKSGQGIEGGYERGEAISR